MKPFPLIWPFIETFLKTLESPKYPPISKLKSWMFPLYSDSSGFWLFILRFKSEIIFPNFPLMVPSATKSFINPVKLPLNWNCPSGLILENVLVGTRNWRSLISRLAWLSLKLMNVSPITGNPSIFKFPVKEVRPVLSIMLRIWKRLTLPIKWPAKFIAPLIFCTPGANRDKSSGYIFEFLIEALMFTLLLKSLRSSMLL